MHLKFFAGRRRRLLLPPRQRELVADHTQSAEKDGQQDEQTPGASFTSRQSTHLSLSYVYHYLIFKQVPL